MGVFQGLKPEAVWGLSLIHIQMCIRDSPFSVRDEKAPRPDLSAIKGKLPLLGVCYGAQYLAHYFGGEVKASNKREYGRANLSFVDNNCPLFKHISQHSQVWMSHGDTIETLPVSYTHLSFSQKRTFITPFSVCISALYIMNLLLELSLAKISFNMHGSKLSNVI